MRLSNLLEEHPLLPLLRLVAEVAHDIGMDAHVVGGFVRDLLLGRDTSDVDFVTVGPGTGIRLAEAVGARMGGATLHVYRNYGTAAIRVPFNGTDVVLEFVAARRESYRSESRNPSVEDGTLQDDQLRRDFTVNALAIRLADDALIDPFEGVADLDRGVLRTPLEADRTFEDDPLRMIRAARFAAQLSFTIHSDVLAGMRSKADRVAILSNERIADELQKMICAPRPGTGFRLLEETGVLPHFFPELSALRGVEAVDGQRHKDNFYHTLQVVENLVASLPDRTCDETRWLRWAALLHDIGKPSTKRFRRDTGWTFHSHEEQGARMIPDLFRRLRLPGDERMKYVQKLIRLHHRPVSLVDESVTDSAVRRLLFDAGEDIDDLMALVRADITSKNPARVRRYLRAFDHVDDRLVEVEEMDKLRSFQPPLDGLEIMATLGIEAGLAVGIIKTAVREAILDGRIPNEHDAARLLMMQHKDDALRRGALFETTVRRLEKHERRAVGAIKEAVLSQKLPATDQEAVAFLDRVKDQHLAGQNP